MNDHVKKLREIADKCKRHNHQPPTCYADGEALEAIAEAMTENPWREAIVAALKERNRYFEHDTREPAALLDDLLREVASIASHHANNRLRDLSGMAEQLIATGLAIRAAQRPEDRADVAITFEDAAKPFKARIAEDTIPVIDAWARGCEVQSRYRDVEDEWRDVGRPGEPCLPNFLHPMLEYRIKPS